MESNSKSIYLPILVALFLSIGIFFGFHFLRDQVKVGPMETRLKEVIALIEENYVDEVEAGTLLENALVGISKGFPGRSLVSKNDLDQCDRMKSFGLITFPGGSFFLVVNVFPGSVPGILGLSSGDRIQNVIFSENSMKFDLIKRWGRGADHISIPDSLAVFRQPVVEYQLDKNWIYSICLSPSIPQLLEYFEEVGEAEIAGLILDLRLFSNVGGFPDKFESNSLKVDSVVTGPNTFGIGSVLENFYTRRILSVPNGFETENFIIVNSVGKELPQFRMKEKTISPFLDSLRENEILAAGEFLKEVLNREEILGLSTKLGPMDLENLNQGLHLKLFQMIRKDGIKKAYKSLL
jgi:hypothetical protein